jgi:hypothetical protein
MSNSNSAAETWGKHLMVPRLYSYVALSIAMSLVMTDRVSAAIVVYTSETAFETAAQNLNHIDFVGLAAADDYAYFLCPPGLTINGVNFQSAHRDSIFVMDAVYYNNQSEYSGTQPILMDNYGGGIDISIALGGARAIACTVGETAHGPTGLHSFVFSTGDSYTFTTQVYGSLDFFGFISDAPIVSLRYAAAEPGGGNGNPYLAEFEYGQPVPEPSTLAIFSLLGAGGWLGMKLRRRRSQPVGRQPWSPEARQAIHEIIGMGARPNTYT